MLLFGEMLLAEAHMAVGAAPESFLVALMAAARLLGTLRINSFFSNSLHMISYLPSLFRRFA